VVMSPKPNKETFPEGRFSEISGKIFFKKFKSDPAATGKEESEMLKNTKTKMTAYAQTLPPSKARAQCYNIANLELRGKTIAQAMLEDHRTLSGALRASELMVGADCANEVDKEREGYYGTFVYEDGSKLNAHGDF